MLEELLIRIRSVMDGSGFDQMKSDLEKAEGQQTRLNNSVQSYNTYADQFKGKSQEMGESLVNAETRGESAFSRLRSSASSAFESVKSGVSSAKESVSSSFSRISSVASGTFSSIKSGAARASESIRTMNDGLGGVISTFGLLAVAEEAWSGATQRQFNIAWLSMKEGTSQAKSMVNEINQIVAAVPGDDTFMNALLTGSVVKQSNLSNDSLKQLGNTAADYLAITTQLGKSQIEAQNDLKNYILTGQTGDLVRGSPVSADLDMLKNKATVQERIVALQAALNKEGYAGVSQMDTAANKAEQFKGELELAATDLGTAILPTIQSILTFLISLDSQTGGWSSRLLVAGAVIMLLVGSLGMIAMPFMAFFDMVKLIGGGFTSAARAMAVFTGAVEEGAVAEMTFAEAAWAALVPLLPYILVAAVIIAIVVAIYEVGKAMGWWSDLNSFGAVIMANLTNAWNIFVNALYGAWGAIVGFGQYIYNLPGMIGAAITSFVGAIIAGLWALPGEIQASLWAGLLFVAYWVPFMIGYAIRCGADFVTAIGLFFWYLPGNIYLALVNAEGRIVAFGHWIYTAGTNAGRNFLNGTILFFRQAPGRIWAFLVDASGRIVAFGHVAYTDAVNAGRNVYNGLRADIANAPGMVQDELNRIGQAIINIGGTLYNDAVQLGQNIYNGLLDGLGIHSPGFMYHALHDELGRMENVMYDSQATLNVAGQGVGSSIIGGFIPAVSSKTLVSPAKTGNNTSSQTIAPVFNLYGDIDSEERKDSFIQGITMHLSDLNDSKGR